jgi:Fur family transcriptional regulator, ferric uptake regulator
MESNHHRRTPERSTILDTIYSMGEHFSIEDLGRELLKRNIQTCQKFLATRRITRQNDLIIHLF